MPRRNQSSRARRSARTGSMTVLHSWAKKPVSNSHGVFTPCTECDTRWRMDQEEPRSSCKRSK